MSGFSVKKAVTFHHRSKDVGDSSEKGTTSGEGPLVTAGRARGEPPKALRRGQPPRLAMRGGDAGHEN